MRFITLLLLILAAQSAQAGLYRWKDEQGKIHYSAKPPASENKPNPAKTEEEQSPKSPTNPYSFNRVTVNHSHKGGFSYTHVPSGKRLTHAEAARMRARQHKTATSPARSTPPPQTSVNPQPDARPSAPLTLAQQEALDNKLLCDSARANLQQLNLSSESPDTVTDPIQRRRLLDARKSVEDYCN